MAYYPRKRAKREMPSFKTFSELQKTEGASVRNFLGYKAGMLHAMGKSAHKGSAVFGQTVSMPATVLECPPMKVYGIRAYTDETYGERALCEVWADKTDKNLKRKIKTLGKAKKDAGKEEAKGKAKGKEGEEKSTAGRKAISDLKGIKDKISDIRLMVHTQPVLTGIGKKKPDVTELALTGTVDEQLAYAEEKLGKEITIDEVFASGQFVDVKAVDKGKGIAGVVKRFGVKTHRPKAKKQRVVGSIGPWHPATVMHTVARAGQLGYQARTEYNKRILEIGESGEDVTPEGGFLHYGVVKNNYLLLAGSVPGPVKRAIALRQPMRGKSEYMRKLSGIEFVSTKPGMRREISAQLEAAKSEEAEKTSVKGKVRG